MKKLFLLVTVLFAVHYAEATIYRVGYTGLPVSGVDFSYSDLQSAVNAASSGDTIQVYQQTATTTVGATIDRPLKLIGFGHSLNANTNLQVQNATDSSLNSVSYLYFYPGSEGSIIQGFNLGPVEIYASNITITRCRFKSGLFTSSSYGSYPSYMTDCSTGQPYLITDGHYVGIHSAYGNINNIKISGCYFDNMNETVVWAGQSQHSIFCDGPNLITNLNVSNNYFNSTVSLANNNSTNGMVTGVFANNILNFKFKKLFNIAFMLPFSGIPQNCTEGFFDNYSQFTGSGMQSRFDQLLIKNNIFNTADTVTWPIMATNSIVQNNLFSCASQYAGVTLGAASNVFKTNMNTVFGTTWNNGMVYDDSQLVLGASSPAISAGIKYNNTATNAGIYGGETDQEYKPSGIPSVPAIYQLSAPSLNATTNPYNITISVRSNK